MREQGKNDVLNRWWSILIYHFLQQMISRVPRENLRLATVNPFFFSSSTTMIITIHVFTIKYWSVTLLLLLNSIVHSYADSLIRASHIFNIFLLSAAKKRENVKQKK
jgi:hypothetical protein